MFRQSGQTTALNEFFEWENEELVEVVADVTTIKKFTFLPIEKVKAYFAEDHNNKLSGILCEVFDVDYPPIDAEMIRDHTAIFCILLSIGHGRLIEHFAQYEELSDRRLPFDPSHPIAEFPEEDGDPTFQQRFFEKQHMYCVPVFDGLMHHRRFGAQRLLPIIHASPSGIEEFSSNYVIKLYQPHNKLLPRGPKTEPSNSQLDTFVLKQYATKAGERYYRDEVNGFRSVKHADSIIRYYGSYIHGNTYNTLLEFADKGSLEEYFKLEAPPSKATDIIKFWESMFHLIKGLKAVHSVRQSHQNIKPDSILVLSNGSELPSRWVFKLANFGIIHDGDTVGETHGTSQYGPPQSYISRSPSSQDGAKGKKTSWTSDIWSLGCIFSEAAIWIADGYRGLLDYRAQRTSEVSSESFHDNERVLASVLDAHRDVEDRLRRSDYITKDVLETMVDEMLWEEDRPNAKALLRKSEMVLTRARQKVPTSSGAGERQRPGSRQKGLPARRRPPTQPLPPLPPLPRGGGGGGGGGPPNLASISEQQYPLNVEKWRSQVGGSQSIKQPFSDTASDITSHSFAQTRVADSETISELDREIGGSIASWSARDNDSVASPSTPFTSPHASVQYDYQHMPNEGRPRMTQSQRSYEHRRQRASSQIAASIDENESVTPIIPPSAPIVLAQSAPTNYTEHVLAEHELTTTFSKMVPDARSIGRETSRSSSRHSSYSIPSARSVQKDSVFASKPAEIIQARTKSEKRLGGFSLFPIRGSNPSRDNLRTLTLETTRQSTSSVVSSANTTPMVTDLTLPITYLSPQTCMLWKNSKKGKKAKGIPLPGADLLECLKGRDHVFIIDDSASMAGVWPEVKRVFEILSYILKGFSPDGTELFFTISYDTYRRKDTSDLCAYMEKHVPAGRTNIEFRLGLQLEAYRARRPKLLAYGPAKGKKDVVRPLSLYVLSNGEWGGDPKRTIKQTAEYLNVNDVGKDQVTVQFISFAEDGSGMETLEELAKEDFGLDIVDCTRSTGNVLKMLLGPLERSLPEEPPESGPMSRQATVNELE